MIYSTIILNDIFSKIGTNLGQQVSVEKMNLILLVSRLKKENFIVEVNQHIINIIYVINTKYWLNFVLNKNSYNRDKESVA